MFERLQLWRLANFAVERLPAPDDVYLVRAVAHSNPKDQRLLAVGEVRDLTPVRDDDGRIVALPQLERVLLDALEGMRRVQAPLPPERRYQWNRVLLYVWPPFDLTLDEIERVARSLAPATEGLGIEEIEVQCLRPDPATGELRERLDPPRQTRPARGSSSSRTTCRPSRCSRSTSTPRRSCSLADAERRTRTSW